MCGELELSRLEIESPEILIALGICVRAVSDSSESRKHGLLHFRMQDFSAHHTPWRSPAGSGPFNISNNAWHGRTGALRSFAGVGVLITGQGRARGTVAICREELTGTFHTAAVTSAVPSISGKKKIQI